MNRCAVVIGVNKTGDLDVLHAAASGARDFAAWATKQGIAVTLLTDDDGRVSLGDVKAAIHAYVAQRVFDQMIVFFSGHGLLRAPDFELWLLSGAPDDPNDAVNVPGSIHLARNVGIPHVVVVSDACRSLPRSARLAQVQGGLIFPNELPRPARPAVDVFYAALPGDTALEASTEDATESFRGLFTECLLKGLSGEVPDIVELDDAQAGEERWVVRSGPLKPYLEQGLPQAVASVHIKFQQHPEVRVESHPSSYLAAFSANPSLGTAPETARSAWPADVTSGHAKRSLFQDPYLRGRWFQDRSLRSTTRAVAERFEAAGAIDRLLEARGRESFETRTGFTVIGSSVERAVATVAGCEVFQDAGAFQVRVPNDGHAREAQTALVQLEGGYGIPLAVLPGFIGTVVVEDGRVVTVSYVPSRFTPRYADYEAVADELEERRAVAAVAARNGSFRFEGGVEVSGSAQYLRSLKAVDPTLALYSAYAFAQAGDLEGGASVFEAMRREPEPLLFDVAMLSGTRRRPDGKRRRLARVTPFCPMLTQGWAYLDAYRVSLPRAVGRAREHARPGLWTTFDERGMASLWPYVEDGGGA